MLVYQIKHDGYPIGQAKGKNKAIEQLKHYLAWEGIIKAKWINKNGDIIVEANDNIFTIEKFT